MAFFSEPMDERYTWKKVRLVLETWRDLDAETEEMLIRLEHAAILLKHGKVTVAEVIESFRED